MAEPECIDCIAEGVTTKRDAKHGGPRSRRCTTHHRAFLAARRARSRSRYVEKTYSLTEEQYQTLYEAQGGVCYLCRRAKGNAKKRLSVDHDHKCCPGPVSCGKCVRGLLCKPCNQDVLGHFRDEVAAFERCIEYLTNPPARRVLPFAA